MVTWSDLCSLWTLTFHLRPEAIPPLSRSPSVPPSGHRCVGVCFQSLASGLGITSQRDNCTELTHINPNFLWVSVEQKINIGVFFSGIKHNVNQASGTSCLWWRSSTADHIRNRFNCRHVCKANTCVEWITGRAVPGYFVSSVGGWMSLLSPGPSFCNNNDFVILRPTKRKKSLMMMMTIIAALRWPKAQRGTLDDLPSARRRWGFLMQLHRVVCYWFPWWSPKINIKVSDRRAAYWFKRSQSCSSNVSRFDLWPVFMFSDNTAGSGWDCGLTEETAGLHTHTHLRSQLELTAVTRLKLSLMAATWIFKPHMRRRFGKMFDREQIWMI